MLKMLVNLFSGWWHLLIFVGLFTKLVRDMVFWKKGCASYLDLVTLNACEGVK